VAVSVGQQSQITRTFDGLGQLALIFGRGASYAARHDLTGLADVGLEQIQVLVVDFGNALGGKLAITLAAKKRDMKASDP